MGYRMLYCNGPATLAADPIVLSGAMQDGLVIKPSDGVAFRDGPDFGRVLVFGADTGGRYGLMTLTVAPSALGAGMGAHLHRGMEETFLVQSGEIDFLIGETVQTLRAGDFVRAPAGVRHGYVNRSGAPVELLVGFHPGGFETLFIKYSTDLNPAPDPAGFMIDAAAMVGSEFEDG